MPPAIITIGVDPTIELGPITLAWHGITIAPESSSGAWSRAAGDLRLSRWRGWL
jgi:hypothetical protein